LLGFILLPETGQGPGLPVAVPALEDGTWSQSRSEEELGAPSPRKWVSGIPEVMHNSCRLGREMPCARRGKR